MKNLIEKAKKNLIKVGQIEVKSFLRKHFWNFLNKMKFKFIRLIQIQKPFLLNGSIEHN